MTVGEVFISRKGLKRIKKIKLIQKCVPFVIVSKVIQRPAVFAGPILVFDTPALGDSLHFGVLLTLYCFRENRSRFL